MSTFELFLGAMHVVEVAALAVIVVVMLRNRRSIAEFMGLVEEMRSEAELLAARVRELDEMVG